jgi:two-component system sensor histidine kinase CreC
LVSIRLRIVVCFIVLTGAGGLALSFLVARDLWPLTLQTAEESLVDTSAVLASLLEAQLEGGIVSADLLRSAMEITGRRRLEAAIYEITKRQVDLRVYVTDARGIVLYDSDGGRDEGRDYSQWNDVYLTLQGRYGARATRGVPEDTVSSVLYVATPIRSGDRIVGALSVGKPVAGIKLFMASTRNRILAYTAALVLFASFVSLALAGWITIPIRHLTAYARAVGEGRRPELPRLGSSEIAVLGSALESMRDALEGKRYVENYVRSLTHEIKAPLAAIRAASELLDEKMSPEDRRRFIRNIRIETERLHRLAERLLELSALESRKRLETATSIDLAELAREVAESAGPSLRRKRLRLDIDVDGAPCVVGDRFLVRQALMNLIQNAVNATPVDGTIRIGVESDAELATLVVDDTGPGVPDYALPRVFDKFYSLPIGDQPGSTGLGLPFVREVALLHGGDARLDNRDEGGARATLRLARRSPRTD